MKYHDDVYRSQTIEEPVLLALMQSEPLQRLRGVMQHGITGLMGITEPVTRFDHSVGTMLLVRRMGGNLQRKQGLWPMRVVPAGEEGVTLERNDDHER
jgi:HD superfamily phosphohydrolase